MTPETSPLPPQRRRFAALPWWLLLLAVSDWVALKTGLLGHSPELLAALAGLAMLALLARLAFAVGDLRFKRRRPGAILGEVLLLAGLLLALGAGALNWLLGLQGFVILHEGEVVPLFGGSHLQELVTGPMSRLEEMELVLGLEELELEGTGDGYFIPRSRLSVQRPGETPVSFGIDPLTPGVFGSLRFYQGAFGFAPRIVILRGEESVFDRVVPFTTERRGPDGVSFDGHFTVERETLEVLGTVDLSSLDEGMRGHPILTFSVSREGTLLGRGRLLPGHFAELSDGWRVGFAGLSKWSEIDLSRRTYALPIVGGTALALAGGLLWPVARWRGW